MHCLIILLCLILQINVVHEDLQFRNVDPENLKSNDFFENDYGLSTLDVVMLFLVFCAAYISYQRRKTNKILHKELTWMKTKCKHQDYIVGNLSTFLEDSRSKNSRLEMPLRKLSKRIESFDKEICKQISDVEHLCAQFTEFRKKWSVDAAPFINIPEAVLLAKMEAIKIKTEMDMLKEYINCELEDVKSVVHDNKVLLAEAEGDIDRLFISEGL